ncbi:unnamed protein product [Arctogadus glacialis]
MPPKKRRTPSTNGNTIERFFKTRKVRENAGANREEVGEEGVPGGGVTGDGVSGGRMPGGGVPGGGVRGGGSEENPDATQEETAGSELKSVSLIPADRSLLEIMEVKKEKAEELHGHTFSWMFGKEDPYDVVCKKAGTIYESLQTSDAFKEKAFKNQGKELVILRPNKKAINSNFPCHKMIEANPKHQPSANPKHQPSANRKHQPSANPNQE